MSLDSALREPWSTITIPTTAAALEDGPAEAQRARARLWQVLAKRGDSQAAFCVQVPCDAMTAVQTEASRSIE